MARINGDPKYQLYRHGKSFKTIVGVLLEIFGVDLAKGRGYQELRQFQGYFSEYKIVILMF
jgi:hypothetical protein